MPIIKQDDIGIYTVVNGWIARPANNVTSFKINDNITGKHFGGSSIVGINKLPGRGKYSEYWHTDIPFNKNNHE